MKEEVEKAVKLFGREDLISDYGIQDTDTNIQVFMSVKDMIKYYNQKKEIDRLNNIINELENFLTNKLMSIPCEVFKEENLETERQTKVACYQVALGKLLKLKELKEGDNNV